MRDMLCNGINYANQTRMIVVCTSGVEVGLCVANATPAVVIARTPSTALRRPGVGVRLAPRVAEPGGSGRVEAWLGGAAIWEEDPAAARRRGWC